MNNDLHARDCTQQERLDAFGTVDVRELITICKERCMPHTVRANRLDVVIWRCHLPADLELVLQRHEDAGVVYAGGWSKAS